MTTDNTSDSITRSVDVPVPPGRAWDGFVHDFAGWWPSEHCFCGKDALDHVFIDIDRALWGEVTKAGETRPWGSIILVEAPERLILGWQMDATVSPWVPEPDRGRASIIEICFQSTDTGSHVTLTHREFARQGPKHAAAMREVMIGLDRWAEWLNEYAESLHTAPTRPV